MKQEYRIIRTSGTLVDLEAAVNRSGGIPQGGPSRDPDSKEWFQAVRILAEQNGDVRLQEPAKAKRK